MSPIFALSMIGFAVTFALIIIIYPTLPLEQRSKAVLLALLVIAIITLLIGITDYQSNPSNPVINQTPLEKTGGYNSGIKADGYVIALYTLMQAVSANCYGITNPPDLCTSIHSEIAYDTERQRLASALLDFGEWVDNILRPISPHARLYQRLFFRLVERTYQADLLSWNG